MCTQQNGFPYKVDAVFRVVGDGLRDCGSIATPSGVFDTGTVITGLHGAAKRGSNIGINGASANYLRMHCIVIIGKYPVWRQVGVIDAGTIS